MSDRASRTIAALRAGHGELADLVEGMSPDTLDRTSAAREWTIAQVLSHLGSGAEIMLGTVDGALAGSGGAGPESMREVWARWDAMAAAEQAAGFVRADETLVARLEGLDQAVRDELRIDLGFLPEPADVATVAALRLNELTYHSWDVRVVLDPVAELAAEAVELLFQPLEMLIGFLGKPDQRSGPAVTLAVHTTEPERSFTLELGDSIGLGAAAPAEATDVLDIPAEALLRLTAGRLGPEYTPAGVRLTSDTITLDDLRRVFPGF
jgi:uncharacterized protein (TIGR03083 family)